MRKFTVPSAAVLLGVILSAAASSSAQQVDPVKAAAEALGASNLKSVRFTGLGANFSVGQNPSPGEPWPRVTIKSYDAAVNYETASMRVELVREQGSIPPRGGGLPFTGEQRFMELVSGTRAWNVSLVPPPPPPPTAPGTPAPVAQASGGRPRFVEQPPEPQFAAAAERMQQIWLTPHGFLRAAMANHATTKPAAGGTEVAFTIESKYKFTGIINRRNQVERVETWIANPLSGAPGDMPFEALYSDYERVDGGVSFPMRIVQKQGGFPSLDLWIFSVQPNAAADIATPEAVRSAIPAPARVEAQKIAEGVLYLTGGSHHSVAIEMRDHVVLVEAPLDEERSRAVAAKINEIIPAKPIRVVVNTHHHFDHAGGLKTFADLGATIVTHEMNRAFYEKAWGKTAAFQTFTDKYVLTDGVRTVEVHRIANSPHAGGFAMVYLPAEKLLIEADAYTPAIVPPAAVPTPALAAAPVAAPPAVPVAEPAISPTTLNLYENIRRLNLDVKQIAALHGPRLATMEDLARASGR
jgi:glyoxylase-like metal-dependent hydrolase (beta-lactamase superfamily II)